MRVAPCLLLLYAVQAAAQATGGASDAPVVRKVAPGTWFVQESLHEGREPDGNSVVFEAPRGLVVLDSGRHAWHRKALMRLAREQERPIVALFNSHWHLDHVGGNAALRAAYPGLRVYASDAIEGALGGFLAHGLAANGVALADPSLPGTLKEDLRADDALVREAGPLRPDVVVTATATLQPGGRALQVHLARDAATAGDVWLYDERTRVAALGDLVTLPAPFLDTACPAGWRTALEEVAATPFTLALPGHGGPMSRAQFDAWRKAFGEFVDCAASGRPAGDCASGWADGVQSLQLPGEAARARGYAAYYVDLLRSHGGRSAWCATNG